jgi:hopanoid biosynthesis associated protein HpnK
MSESPASSLYQPGSPTPTQSRKRLIVNADDFGRTASINPAVIRAHRDGILTTTSLMVNEPACEQAVELARANPTLGVGLHLTLLCGHSALGPEQVPGLINGERQFTNNPAGAGFRYFFQRSLREQLRAEIHAQFAKFRATGLKLDHVNGHLHLHLHPVIFRMLMADAAALGIERVRLTFDPFRLNLRLASGRLGYRLLHVIIFHWLSARARPVLRRRNFRCTDRVFGLLQNALVDEPYVLNLLAELPPGDSELYSHPSLDEFRNEFEALVSPRVRERVKRLGVQLIRYQDL